MPGRHNGMSAYLQTGQITCHDARGRMIDCAGSGQDADFRSGLPWPAPRFEVLADVVLDRMTELVWTRNANMAEFPLAWKEALDHIATMYSGFLTGVCPTVMNSEASRVTKPGNRLCPRGIPFSTYSADGTGLLRLRRSILPMLGISIWKAHGCFTA